MGFPTPALPPPAGSNTKTGNQDGGQESPPSWRSCVFQERGFSYPRSSPSGRVEYENRKPRRGDRKVPPPGAPACSRSGGFPTPALPPPAGSKTKTGNQDGGTEKSPLLALLRVPGAGVFLPPLFPFRQGRKRKRETKTGGQESPPSWRSCVFLKRSPPSAADRHDPTRKTRYLEATAFQPPLLLDGSFSPAGIVIARRLK